MLFQTTQAHEELRAKIRAFAEAEVKPNAILMDQESRFPAEAVKTLAGMGLMGIPYPKEYALNKDKILKTVREKGQVTYKPGLSELHQIFHQRL